MATYKITSITSPALQTGTDNLYFCRWSFSKKNTKEFSWEWQYTHNGSVWFSGGSGTTSYSDGPSAFTATYNPPDNASAIRFRVKPVPKQVKKGKKTVDAFKGAWSNWVMATRLNVYPEDAQAPNIEIDNNTLTVRCETSDPLSKVIEFEIVQNDRVVCYRAKAVVYTGVATIKFAAPPGGEYKARCLAYNGGYHSRNWSSYSTKVSTSPNQITKGMVISTTTERSVRITLNETISGAVKYAIQYATKKEYFETGGEVTSVTTDEVIGRSFYVSGLSATEKGDIYYFRVAAINKENQQAPWSPLDMPGSSIILGTKPTAPTTWQSTSTAKIGESVTLYWLHNSEDGSKENKAVLKITEGDQTREIEVPPQPGTDYYESTESKPNFYILDTSGYDKDTTVSWAVKTKGVVPEYGPYSSTRKIEIYYPPTIALNIFKRNEWWWDPFDFEEGNIATAPGEYQDPYDLPIEIIPHYPLFVGVEVFPKSVQPLEAMFKIFSVNAYQTQDYAGDPKWVGMGEEIFSRVTPYEEIEGMENIFHLPLLPKDVSLEDGETYRLQCTVAMSNGLTTTEEITFTVEFEEMGFDINADIEYDPELTCCYIQPYCTEVGDGEEEMPLIKRSTVSVYRKNFDGQFIAIGENLRNTERITVLDPHPTLRRVVYRIVARSDKTGAIYYNDLDPIDIEEIAIIIQWDENWRDLDYNDNYDEEVNPPWVGEILKLPYNVDTSDSASKDRSLVEYIGRPSPVGYYGTQIGQKVTLNSDVPYDENRFEVMEKMRKLQRFLGNAYVREPTGIGYWADVAISFSVTHRELKIPVTVEAVRVEGGL